LGCSQPFARIDLDALAHNFAEVRRLVGPSVAVLPMVKAGAYGHGAVDVTRTLAGLGCAGFGVATLDEAAQVADAAAGARIVVFGGVLASDARRIVELGVEVGLHDRSVAEAVAAAAVEAGRDVPVHVKVDTGMRRFGVEPDDAASFIAMMMATPGISPVALWSHFAMAESVTTEVTEGQLERLEHAAAAVRAGGAELPCHLANSAGIMTRPGTHLDMVRPGLMLYGLYPDAALADRADLRPVMSFEAPVVRIAQVGPGEGIGYGHTYRTTRTSRLATLRCGYADGYPRALSNRGHVVLHGKRVPVVGRVCMDHTIIDVTDLDEVALGDRALLWGPGLDAGEVAAVADTISYELVARVGARVERRHEAAP